MIYDEVTFDRSELVLADSIPATLMTVPGARGLVVFSNGFSAPRQQAVPPGVPENPISPPLVAGLLAAGYDVVAPENPAHGERLAPGQNTLDALSSSFGGESSNVLDAMQEETAALVDDIIATGIGTPGRIAALGHSWGGLATLLRLAGDQRIDCGVALIPVVDPRCLDSLKSFSSGPVLSRFDLAERVGPALGQRPLLIIAGAIDQVTPPDLTRDFVSRLRAAYRPPRFSYVELEGVGHEYAPAQLARSLDWLDSRLQ